MQDSLPIIFINGEISNGITVFDRGFQYGDGVFETIKLNQAGVPLFDYHIERVVKSCERLGINSNKDLICAIIEMATKYINLVPAVLKLIVTRGVDGIAYNPKGANSW